MDPSNAILIVDAFCMGRLRGRQYHQLYQTRKIIKIMIKIRLFFYVYDFLREELINDDKFPGIRMKVLGL